MPPSLSALRLTLYPLTIFLGLVVLARPGVFGTGTRERLQFPLGALLGGAERAGIAGRCGLGLRRRGRRIA